MNEQGDGKVTGVQFETPNPDQRRGPGHGTPERGKPHGGSSTLGQDKKRKGEKRGGDLSQENGRNKTR